jgi:hypothetical protein
VIDLADAIFLLKDEDGFDILLSRIALRPLRSVYFEAIAAKYFRNAGFRIEIRKEAFVRGHDFDFSASNQESGTIH